MEYLSYAYTPDEYTAKLRCQFSILFCFIFII